MEHFGKTVRANQRCAEEEVSAVLSGVEVASVDDSMSREDAVTHLTSHLQVTPWSLFSPLSPDVYSDKIKHLPEPPPEHGRIQFHRLNIKNDYRLEGHQDVGSAISRMPFRWLSIALKTTSSSFISPLARCVGMLLGAFPQRITLCYR
ncbi:UDP-D-apiose/UDP-D-xylose synthase [Ananas comosus]|uniref:UDP-D-apiose/UDP-D-xylose synthase n=1 Tax=Ananas comosus TaxID=4615 RepID=A0A199VUG5_ANACO|nr:UDP-D-apiose/UDP-D-xylose synthase [Ananas comosus]